MRLSGTRNPWDSRALVRGVAAIVVLGGGSSARIRCGGLRERLALAFDRGSFRVAVHFAPVIATRDFDACRSGDEPDSDKPDYADSVDCRYGSAGAGDAMCATDDVCATQTGVERLREAFVSYVRGIGDIPAGPTTVILTRPKTAPGTTFSLDQSPAVSTGKGPSYTINPDGSTSWFDALGNPITDIAAYNAAVIGAGDSGAAAFGSSSPTVSAGLPSWLIPAGVGILAFILFMGSHR